MSSLATSAETFFSCDWNPCTPLSADTNGTLDSWTSCDEVGSQQGMCSTGEGVYSDNFELQDVFDDFWCDYPTPLQIDSSSSFTSKFNQSDLINAMIAKSVLASIASQQKLCIPTADVGVQTISTSIHRSPVDCHSHPVQWGLSTAEPSPLTVDHSNNGLPTRNLLSVIMTGWLAY